MKNLIVIFISCLSISFFAPNAVMAQDTTNITLEEVDYATDSVNATKLLAGARMGGAGKFDFKSTDVARVVEISNLPSNKYKKGPIQTLVVKKNGKKYLVNASGTDVVEAVGCGTCTGVTATMFSFEKGDDTGKRAPADFAGKIETSDTSGFE